jgi:hypothetical protein
MKLCNGCVGVLRLGAVGHATLYQMVLPRTGPRLIRMQMCGLPIDSHQIRHGVNKLSQVGCGASGYPGNA